jgi:hypothetical protein
MFFKSATPRFCVPLSIAIANVCLIGRAAEAPSAVQALSLQPLQSGVEYTIPSKEEAAQCTVRLERDKNTSNWVVTNRQGEILRRFYDTNADNYVDMWCYYLGGIEVYRDIDSNFNNKADQYRWFHTAGTRWAIDKNEDGRIDSWKVISPHEVAEQAVLALKNRDQARFELLLPTASELSAWGFGQARAESIAASVKSVPAEFSKLLAEQKVVTPETRYLDFNSARPATIPAGTAGSTKDVTICDNAAALIQTGDKHEQVYLGTLVADGNTWKLIDVPTFGGENQRIGSDFLIAQDSAAASGAAADNPPSERMQKLLAELEKLDREADRTPPEQMAANVEQRVDVMQSLADIATGRDKDQWYRQMADVLGIAIQTGDYPQGAERLEQLQKKLTEAKADEDLIAHAHFQRMWAQFAVSQHEPNANAAQLQAKWLADLQAFINQYPKCSDTAEALFQLGMYQEFEGKPAEATKQYQQLVTNFPNASSADKAKGALRRLESLGKPISLKGNDINGGTIDLAKYRGKAVLIHYWATMGERWKEDMILLRDYYAKKGGAEFDIIGVCLDDDPAAAKQYLSQNKIPWKQICEHGGLDGRLANEMGVLTLPLMILVDQKGNVANQNIHVAELDTELARLGKPAAETTNALRATPTSR